MIIEAPTRGRGDDKHGKPDEQILVARPNLGGLIATNFFVDFAENVGHELLGAVYPGLVGAPVSTHRRRWRGVGLTAELAPQTRAGLLLQLLPTIRRQIQKPGNLPVQE